VTDTQYPNDILIVEDEPKLALVMADFLRASGYSPRWVADGLDVQAAVAEHMPLLIILDLMLPGRDGRDICRDLRRDSEVPIIMVTAQVDEVNRLLGLELGADDYICKPFSPLELVARVKAILRRARVDFRSGDTTGDSSGDTSPLQLHEATLQATFRGSAIELTAIEFRLLSTLASRPSRVFSRNALMDQLYTDGRIVDDRTVDSHVKKIRRKLEAIAPGEGLVQSVYGAGFKLVL
jgi:two-component system response regulator BaeR